MQHISAGAEMIPDVFYIILTCIITHGLLWLVLWKRPNCRSTFLLVFFWEKLENLLRMQRLFWFIFLACVILYILETKTVATIVCWTSLLIKRHAAGTYFGHFLKPRWSFKGHYKYFRFITVSVEASGKVLGQTYNSLSTTVVGHQEYKKERFRDSCRHRTRDAYRSTETCMMGLRALKSFYTLLVKFSCAFLILQ